MSRKTIGWIIFAMGIGFFSLLEQNGAKPNGTALLVGLVMVFGGLFLALYKAAKSDSISPIQVSSNQSSEDKVMNEIKDLTTKLEMGVIEQNEFETRKKEALAKL